MVYLDKHNGGILKKLFVLLSVIAGLAFVGTASAGGFHHYHPPVAVAVVSQVDRDGYCTAQPVLRSDSTWGRFVNLIQSDVNINGSKVTYLGQSLTPAFFLQGLGESCEVPAGYHAAGFNVAASDGSVDVAAPQFNIHPLYVKN